MCGILGAYQHDGLILDENLFRNALNTLTHRGPDGCRVVSLDSRVALGHTRLAIIDSSARSDQPFVINDRFWLTYNGEVFNYLELKLELESLGHQFKTSGDVEVLLRAYIEWGEECVHRFNGMWAFAIYDRQENTLFCSRDRFGIKPFNYAFVEGHFIFSSEIKALLHLHPALCKPNYKMIANYCRTSVGAQHEESWFEGVRRLMPGHNMLVSANGTRFSRYWDYPAGEELEADFEQATAAYRDLFEDAVRLRLRSDVPVGITLSSGIDSNSIAHAMQRADPSPHLCFTSRFAESEGLVKDAVIYTDGGGSIDESKIARQTAERLGLVPRVIDTEYREFVDDLAGIIWFLESGHSSPAVLPLFHLLQAASREVRVIMDGQGADELLAGYLSGVIYTVAFDLLKRGKFRSAWRNFSQFRKTYRMRGSLLLMVRLLANKLPALGHLYRRWSGIEAVFGPHLARQAFVPDFPPLAERKGESRLAKSLRRQHAGGLVNLLHYGDAISMANSVEARMPFLDHRLVEAVWRLPGDFKVRDGLGKFLHRQAMRGLVEDSILDETHKFGYATPIGQQFRKGSMKENAALQILLSEQCLKRGLFNETGLRALISRHRSGKADHGTLLFRLLSAELWFRRFVDDLPGNNGKVVAKC